MVGVALRLRRVRRRTTRSLSPTGDRHPAVSRLTQRKKSDGCGRVQSRTRTTKRNSLNFTPKACPERSRTERADPARLETSRASDERRPGPHPYAHDQGEHGEGNVGD